jgi:hypothetical protein
MRTTVWSTPTDPTPPDLDHRAGWAAAALATHGHVSGLGPYHPDNSDGVVHLLTDLMHLTAQSGEDFGALTRAAQRHFLEERLGASPQAVPR